MTQNNILTCVYFHEQVREEYIIYHLKYLSFFMVKISKIAPLELVLKCPVVTSSLPRACFP